MSDQKARLAFEILARENSRMLMAYLRSLISDAAAIDDLYQETMVVAWRLGECDLSRPFGPWLRGIAARLVMAHYRKRKLSPAFLNDDVLEHIDRQFELITARTGDTWEAKTTALHDCIAALSEHYRDAVRGRYFDRLKAGMLAERMGISLEACKKRLVRARGLLADCLKRKGVFVAQEVIQ